MNNDNTTLTTPPPPAFTPGSLVTLRSGGPTMVVKGVVIDDTIVCRWHARFGNHDTLQTEYFHAHELKAVDAEPSREALQQTIIDQQTTITRLEEQLRQQPTKPLTDTPSDAT